MKLKYTFLFRFNLAVMLLFVSCQSEIESSTITTIVAATSTNTVVLQSTVAPTMTTPIITIEAEPTSTPALDVTKFPTIVPQTATPTVATPTIIASTLTPLPTLAANELEVAIEDLLANPMNCDVPCWWNSVLNKTTVFEVQQFLALYQFTFYERYNDQIPDLIEVWVGYNETVNQFDFRILYSFENAILKAILSEQSPPLYDILSRYGQPDEIWLSTVSSVRDGNLAVRLNLVYLQKGMAVGYVVNGNIQDSIVIGCFADKETGQLRLIIPDNTTTYKDFSSIFESDRRYMLLEEATDLAINEFMQRFSDPTQSQCIETPVELWD